ncbi:hypothetical protein OIO90_002170 [Microbotryomycetes sp. JL221]|nr:hypothetical protein OIO90_002170 [Microbotryomycetes sp. JL221]
MDESFVIVDRRHDGSLSSSSPGDVVDADMNNDNATVDEALLSQLAPYFASIDDAASFEWTFEQSERVRHTRQACPDQRLFIDELLSLVGIEGSSVYPPPSANALNQLLFKLLTSSSSLQAHCIIFYLVLADTLIGRKASSSTGTAQFGAAFARDFLLPTGFVRGIEGFFALDTGNFHKAIQALTDPHLTPDFVHKTFDLLGHSQLVNDNDRSSLVLSFWRLSGVAIDSVDEADVVVKALCDPGRKFGVTEAWQLQRKWHRDDNERARLVSTVLKACFGDNRSQKPVPHHLKTLLAQPFTQEEDEWCNAFCLASRPQAGRAQSISASLAVDWRLSKLIAESRPVDALKMWDQAKHHVVATDERTRLLKAVQATLTEVERNALALEIEDWAAGGIKPDTQPKVGSKSTTQQQNNLARPAWQPAPFAPEAPRSLLSLQRSTKQGDTITVPMPNNLPLSASPFLRRDKPLVASTTGSAIGGVQKSLLHAIKQTEASPVKSDVQNTTTAGPRPADRVLLTRPSRDDMMMDTPASEVAMGADEVMSTLSPGPRPTLSGFGTVRMPASMDYGRAFAVNQQNQRSPRPISEQGEDDAMDEDGDSALSDREDFGHRVVQDPAILKTLKAAASTPVKNQSNGRGEDAEEQEVSAARPRSRSDRPSSSTMKKRTVSRSADFATKDKRRAVSTEPQDKPRAPGIKVSGPSSGEKALPPGAFPGLEDDGTASEADARSSVAGDHDDDDDDRSTQAGDDEDQDHSAGTHSRATRSSRRTTKAGSKGTRTRATDTPVKSKRTTRASSVQPSTPRATSRRSTAVDETPKRAAANATGTGTAPPSTVRRSSRLKQSNV